VINIRKNNEFYYRFILSLSISGWLWDRGEGAALNNMI
jgi:hypothetical protein